MSAPPLRQILKLLGPAYQRKFATLETVEPHDLPAWKVRLRVLLEAFPGTVPDALLATWLREEWPDDEDDDPRLLHDLSGEHRGRRRKKVRIGARPANRELHRAGVVNGKAWEGKPLGNGSDPQETLRVVDEPSLREEEDAAAEAAAESQYDTVARSYRPGTPEHADRLARELCWAREVTAAGDVLAAYILNRATGEV